MVGKKKKKEMGICAYCGEWALLTRDHVVAQAFFSKPVPGNIPKVGACARCNNVIKSSGDQLLRELVLFDMASASHPVAQEKLEGAIRAMRRGQSPLARNRIQGPSAGI